MKTWYNIHVVAVFYLRLNKLIHFTHNMQNLHDEVYAMKWNTLRF